MGCGLVKSTHSEVESEQSKSYSLNNPAQHGKFSLFTVNEEPSQYEQSRLSSQRVSAFNSAVKMRNSSVLSSNTNLN